MFSDKRVQNNQKLCMRHWFGDKMSLKAEKQIKVSGMSVEK